MDTAAATDDGWGDGGSAEHQHPAGAMNVQRHGSCAGRSYSQQRQGIIVHSSLKSRLTPSLSQGALFFTRRFNDF